MKIESKITVWLKIRVNLFLQLGLINIKVSVDWIMQNNLLTILQQAVAVLYTYQQTSGSEIFGSIESWTAVSIMKMYLWENDINTRH